MVSPEDDKFLLCGRPLSGNYRPTAEADEWAVECRLCKAAQASLMRKSLRFVMEGHEASCQALSTFNPPATCSRPHPMFGGLGSSCDGAVGLR